MWLWSRLHGVPHSLLGAVLLGMVGRVWHEEYVPVPSLQGAVPVPALSPVLAAMLVTRPLLDRFAALNPVSLRPVALLHALRYLLAQGAVTMSAVVQGCGARGEPHVDVAAFLCLGAVAAVAAPLLRALFWVPVLLAGYLWLQVGPVEVVSEGKLVTATVLLAGAFYVVASGRS